MDSSSAAAMAGDLAGVARVYEHVEPLLRFAHAEQVEEELEASVALLDACAAARDGLRSMRACAFDLEVALRRGDAAAAQIAARAYALLARKARAEVKRQRHPTHELQGTGSARSLREARLVTVAVLERVVTALSRRVTVSAEPSRWSACIVSRAFKKRTRVACEDSENATTTATAVVPSLALRKSSAASRAQRELRALGDTIQHLEDGLELLFRRLVQCRVFLLNMSSS